MITKYSKVDFISIIKNYYFLFVGRGNKIFTGKMGCQISSPALGNNKKYSGI